jgi:hypothetical protein
MIYAYPQIASVTRRATTRYMDGERQLEMSEDCRKPLAVLRDLQALGAWSRLILDMRRGL